MNERLKKIRIELDLSQKEFGDKLGITKAAISRLESGSSNFTNERILSICREFNIDYLWFTEGIGEMFADIPETTLDKLSEEFHLDDFDKKLFSEYLKLTEEQREVLKNYIKNVLSE